LFFGYRGKAQTAIAAAGLGDTVNPHSHIDTSKLVSIVNKCDEIESWSKQANAGNSAAQKATKLLSSARDADSKLADLKRFADPIFSTPKPKTHAPSAPAAAADASPSKANENVSTPETSGTDIDEKEASVKQNEATAADAEMTEQAS
jgi:hypothetical protein